MFVRIRLPFSQTVRVTVMSNPSVGYSTTLTVPAGIAVVRLVLLVAEL